MSTFRAIRSTLLLATLASLLLAGCGGSGTSNAPPPAEQTGDVTQFANPQLLASARTLDTVGVIIIDARDVNPMTGFNPYNAGHIPGAIHAPPSLFLDAENKLKTDAELRTVLGGLGITVNSKIVIYDDTTGSLGAGGFLFWLLEYLGCKDVSILNGGWDQWVAQNQYDPANRPITTVPTILPAQIFDEAPLEATANSSVSIDYVQTNLNNPNLLIIDARTVDEYNGTALNDEAPRPGHIPGAINLPYVLCYNDDKTVLNQADLKILFDSKGITAVQDVVVYSTVGKRSAFIYFLSRLLGYAKVKNYPGSIVEWGNAVPAENYPVE